MNGTVYASDAGVKVTANPIILSELLYLHLLQ